MLTEEYRLLVVTLPYFSGKHHLTQSWGISFPEIAKGIAEIVEKNASKKKVTLLIHDWGSVYGYLLARDRPDLVSRIASVDVGGHYDSSLATVLFFMSYQLLFCLFFALGDPLSTLLLKLWMKCLPLSLFGPFVGRPISELTGSMMYPYW